jgi:NAD(P)-dependent dehydrogenase (short-subunit alcohol dehydrogenase family)
VSLSGSLVTDLEARVAVVTGAGGGLGRAFSLAFAAAGAHVVAADVDEARAGETAGLIEQGDGIATATPVDVSSPQSVQEMVAAATSAYGGIDVLVNNAGLYAGLERRPFYELEPDDWDRVMAINLKGPWLCARACVPHMRDRGSGAIVNIASATVFSGSTLFAHYVASKGGLIALTRAMAREVGDLGIRVNAVAPGFTLTDASRTLMEEPETYSIARGAIKRSAHPEDIVGTVLFLASSASEFVTGQTIIVDGGRQFN